MRSYQVLIFGGDKKMTSVLCANYVGTANLFGLLHLLKMMCLTQDNIMKPLQMDFYCETMISANDVLTPDIPEKCRNENVCSDVPNNYPHKLVDEIIGKHFSVREHSNSDLHNENNLEDIAHGAQMCKSKPLTLIPMAAKDEEGKWYFIINSETNPIQTFTIEECSGTGPCEAHGVSFSVGHKFTCKQKSTVVQMWTLKENNSDRLDMMSFNIPSCCACEQES